ncbi:phosphatidylinositol-specific phospholipase C domain-containing protein [Nannocystis pusilla]|uniref:Phosphoinositide phospholipase C, Ca2+-dependent n=1 Tax=Nannocystis pusilla TaxID=889268 RepID=A0ABS7TQJ4_9BACT|nr:phosphatidylinositol-specific phospholipase C domain-containing protein [Nannocystis pusilla]MBZ5710504.1 hypothetical protein [Nannocystis pusilla]
MRASGLIRGVLCGALGLAGCGEPNPGGATGETATGTSTSTSTGTSTTPGATTDAPTTTTPTSGSGTGGETTSTTSTSEAATSEALTSTTSTSTSSAATSSTSSDSTTTGDGDTDTTGGGSFDDVLTLQHVQVKGTHNSYHREPLIAFDASHEYSHAPLDVQLDAQGVRAFELDVHKGLSAFEVYHISVIDSVTTCSTLSECLGVIGGWSLAHPQHVPIVVWIEIKDSTGGLPIGAGDLDAIDDVIREALPPEQLFTPDDLRGAHADVRAALEAEGWPTLAQVRGQVLVVLLNVEDGHAQEYTDGFTSLDGRAMFARATPNQFTAGWAAIAKLGIGEAEALAQAHAARMLIATNVCGAGDDDGECTERMAAAKAAGIHMLKDDFPAAVDGMTYWLDFPDGNPARCNPVTAPPECTSVAVEDL